MYSTFKFPQFPNTIFASVFTQVQPQVLADIKASLIAGDFDAALINPSHIVSTEHLLFAVHRALVNRNTGSMKAKTLNSEIIYNLSPVNNIMEAFKRFGVDENGSAVIVVRVVEDTECNEIDAELAKTFGKEGQSVDDELLEQLVDVEATRKVYKVKGSGDLTRLVIGSCLVRGI